MADAAEDAIVVNPSSPTATTKLSTRLPNKGHDRAGPVVDFNEGPI